MIRVLKSSTAFMLEMMTTPEDVVNQSNK